MFKQVLFDALHNQPDVWAMRRRAFFEQKENGQYLDAVAAVADVWPAVDLDNGILPDPCH